MPKGNCFDTANKMMLDALSEIDDVVVVHAVCVGTGGDVAGKEFIHAWVEVGNMVFDYSNDKSLIVEKSEYYQAGSVTPDDPERFKTYTREEVCYHMLTTEHHGPWCDSFLNDYL